MHQLRNGVIAMALSALLLAGCGVGDEGDDDGIDAGSGGNGDQIDAGGGSGSDAGGGNAACTVTAELLPNTQTRTVTGIGTIECDASATLSVETCVQWDATGEFEDTQCQTTITSGVDELEVETLASCGLTQGNRFRARVTASVDDSDEPEVLSDDVGCE
jgi:hypothetical protein